MPLVVVNGGNLPCCEAFAGLCRDFNLLLSMLKTQ